MSVQTLNNQAISQLSEEKVDLIKRTICKGSTDDELQLFIHACNRSGLDPFMRQIYAIKRWQDGKEVMTIQTGIDGYRLIAERTGKYIPGRECTFTYKGDKLFSATAYVKKLGPDGQWHEIAHTIIWDEYASKKKDGSLTSMAKDKPHVMAAKCAESGVLRKAFPADLSGLYTAEELPHNEQEHTPNVSMGEIAIVEDKINYSQLMDIENWLDPADVEYKEDLLKFFSGKHGHPITSFSDLPKRFFDACLKSVKKRAEAKAKSVPEISVTPQDPF